MSHKYLACRCGSGKTYNHCCEPFHLCQKCPSTAEQLMRSRYCAFCLDQHTYLAETFLSDNPISDDIEEQPTTQWIQLSILNTQQGTATDNKGFVEFIATFEENGEFFELHEKSRFIKKDKRWFYVDGESEVNNIKLKWKRNEPCWCHSGLKYKKCHG